MPATPALVRGVTRAALQDGNHAVLAPTQVATRDGELVGYASMGGARLFLGWLRSDLRMAESFRAWRAAEAELARTPGPVALLCTEASPLRPFVERFGYQNFGPVNLFWKDIK